MTIERNKALSQWFTPATLANKIAFEMVPRGSLILEPTAGDGSLVRALASQQCTVIANEIDTRYAADLADSGAALVVHQDFIWPPSRVVLGMYPYDLAVMNPPYEKGADGRFVAEALTYAPRVIAIVRTAILNGTGHYRDLWSKCHLHGLAILTRRPQFGAFGSDGRGARSDFCVIDVRREPSKHGTHVQWWTL